MDEETLTVWLDTALLMLGGFVLMSVLMMVVLNPPAQSAENGAKPPGNVTIEALWRDGLDADVDLWVQAPGDRPVGYSNKSGAIFNLLRDDLGKPQDVTDLNYEVAYTRGTPAGEYIVNLHMYRTMNAILPVEVKVVVSSKATLADSSRQLVATTVKLKRENEELTAVRFRLDTDGKLVPGSIHSLYKGLRTAGQ
ncbi:MAG: hypothetical protein ACREEE_10010 [Dongiaceae bacterium]